MLESVFITLFAFGFISFVIAILDEWETLLSLIFCFVSILFFISAWAGSVYVVVPTATHFSELAVGIICFGLIIINAIGAIISIMHVNVEFSRPRH